MKNVLNNLSNLKSKVNRLDVDKLVSVPVDLNKLSDVVKNEVVKKYVYSTKIKAIEDKIPNITNLATNAFLNGKINEDKGEIPDITNLAINASLNAEINEVKCEILNIIELATTTTAPIAVENKIHNVSNLVKKLTIT